MEYRKLGNAGIKVSAVALGAWQTYGGSVDEKSAHECIHTAIEHGINFIDVADIYSKGEAERVVGKGIKDYRRADLVISTKAFWPMSENINDRGLSRKHLIESLEGSLKRLGTEYVDIFFCHRFDPDTPIEETVRAVDDLIQAGKVLYWGTSAWEADQIESAIDVTRKLNAHPLQVEQPRYHMLDRHIESKIIPTCARHGIGLTVWSPLAQGLLTGKYSTGVPKGSRGDISKWLDQDLTEENLEKVSKLSALAEELSITTAELALAWILRLPEISCVITGATNPQHVETNKNAAEIKLDEDVLKQIEKIL